VKLQKNDTLAHQNERCDYRYSRSFLLAYLNNSTCNVWTSYLWLQPYNRGLFSLKQPYGKLYSNN